MRDYMFNVSCVLQPWFAPNPGPDGKRDWSKFDEVVEAMLANGLRTNEVRILVYTLFPKWQDPRKWNGSKEKAFIDSMRDKAKAKSFASRLGDLVKRATAPRVNFDKLALELLRISDEIVKQTR